MKAFDANLLDLLRKSNQLMVPIYQRVYSWERAECQRLWDDILYAGKTESLPAHFTGSIVYVERGQGTLTSAEPDLIIDGQQRVTTVILLLAALAAHLEELPEDQREPVEGFSPRKIRNRYLSNPDEDGDQFFKLILSKADKPALQAVIGSAPLPQVEGSRVRVNFEFFRAKLSDPGVDLVAVCLGLKKLVVVDVRLTRGSDNPQLVFETMNSTGKKLSQADLIRNFVLMDLEPKQQSELYDHYWFPMEQIFAGPYEDRFDEFVRHYLTLKTGIIRKVGDIYEAFKEYATAADQHGQGRRLLVEDLHLHSTWFAAMALEREHRPRLARAFHDIEQLRATVVYPFLLRLYRDMHTGVISEDGFLEVLHITTSYLFRRAACQVPTNTLNSTFAAMGGAIDPNDYVRSIAARYLTLGGSTRFPRDAEFREALRGNDFYHFKRARYFFRKIENEGRKEPVSTAEYSIEHIMPQNERLHTEWQKALGENWKEIHQKYLHTLGNLTLTGYNSEYSDKPFTQKRDMEGGFKHSPLRLNEGLGQLETWNEESIRERSERLAKRALALWPLPDLDDNTLATYRQRFRDRTGFDWTLVHSILEQLPAGRWSGYSDLAEAAGTSAQPLAGHISQCRLCTNPYRILTADGRVAKKFRWSDPDDHRDPRELLGAEGIQFAGRIADPEQRLDAEDLLALVRE